MWGTVLWVGIVALLWPRWFLTVAPACDQASATDGVPAVGIGSVVR